MSGHVHERLSALLDGELDAAQRGAVVAHLASCSECSALLDELARLDQELVRLPVSDPGEDAVFAAAVRARIEAEAPAARGWRRAASPRPLPAWTWAAAAALLLAVVAPLTWHEVRRPSVERSVENKAAPQAASTKGAVPARQAVDADQLEEREAAPPGATTRSAEPSAKRRRLRAAAPAPEAPAASAPAGARAPVAAPAPAPLDAGRGDLEGSVRTELGAANKAGPPPSSAGFAAAPQPAQVSGGVLAKPPREEARRAGPLGLERHSAAREATKQTAADEERPRTVEEWRLLRERWRERVKADPEGPAADQARLREIEAAAAAYRLGRDEEDARILKRDVAAYLARPQAPQRDRVRRLLRETLP